MAAWGKAVLASLGAYSASLRFSSKTTRNLQIIDNYGISASYGRKNLRPPLLAPRAQESLLGSLSFHVDGLRDVRQRLVRFLFFV